MWQQDNHEGDVARRAISAERRKVLTQLDDAVFNRFHLKVCFVAGVGFFTDAYDLFAINIASVMLGNVYGSTKRHGLKVAALVGAITGQLVFGWLADIVGRKRMYGIELCVIIVATFAQALSADGRGINIIGVLIVWRFLQGIGVGADYPLSAVIISEFSGKGSRGRLMTTVFAAQGWGQFTAAIVSTIVVVAFHQQILNSSPDLIPVDLCWRIIIGMGCVPATLALYFRLTIPETPRFTLDIERNVSQASQNVNTFLSTGTFVVDPDAVVRRSLTPRQSRRDFTAYFTKWENGKVLLGTAYSWFVIDIAFYGLGLNNSVIFSNIRAPKVDSDLTGGSAIYQHLFDISVDNLVLSAAALIPGYYMTFLFIDKWGRKPIQLIGFTMLTVLFIIMGAGFSAINEKSPGAFFFLYCLANFFLNFGPNTTTYIIPGEAFPTRYRSTTHGISAATGKVGAIVGQIGFGLLNYHRGSRNVFGHILLILAAFMFTGILSTLLLPETMQRTLEDISNEDQERFIQGVAGVRDPQIELRTANGGPR